jgi:hypothetical protein
MDMLNDMSIQSFLIHLCETAFLQVYHFFRKTRLVAPNGESRCT